MCFERRNPFMEVNLSKKKSYNEIKTFLRKRSKCLIKNKYATMPKVTQNL